MSRLGTGQKRTPESIEKLKVLAQERAKDPAYRKKLSEALTGREIGEEHRRNLQVSAERRWLDPVFRERTAKKISEKAKLRWADPEHREKMKVIHANRPSPPGRPHTEEAKAKMRAFAQTRRASKETKEKMSKSAVESAKRRWADPAYREKRRLLAEERKQKS